MYDGTIDGYRASDLLLVGLLGYGAANTAFAGLAILLVIRRERSAEAHPRDALPAPTYLSASLLSMLVVFVLQSIVMFALAISVFDADGPEDVASLLAVMLLGSAAFAGMGLGTAALIRSADGASAVVNLILLPMAFISGSFVPTQEYPEWLQTIGDVLPLKHLIDLLRGVYLDGDSIVDAPGSVAVLAAWGCSERWWRRAASAGSRASVSESAGARYPLEMETPVAFVDGHKGSRLEILVNFGVLTGREATQAELDRLAHLLDASRNT